MRRLPAAGRRSPVPENCRHLKSGRACGSEGTKRTTNGPRLPAARAQLHRPPLGRLTSTSHAASWHASPVCTAVPSQSGISAAGPCTSTVPKFVHTLRGARPADSTTARRGTGTSRPASTCPWLVLLLWGLCGSDVRSAEAPARDSSFKQDSCFTGRQNRILVLLGLKGIYAALSAARRRGMQLEVISCHVMGLTGVTIAVDGCEREGADVDGAARTEALRG